ncbi:hypothetical protein ELQ35_17115 [Peribacillus cavernae]|uniref:Uncharacterized protein n=1 Tax=Peribacillus cavernae TaxID=1674310 RepID=A0A3S0TXR1_9BACI|nr:hypothetical protein [Peribacillus cavernae]MDQ0219507.1 hypothetical protein [Peribacillus cavernae]RUQ27077.1 hypothetical protein ELQ35_17115 [Peribacillus cavernae]
MRIVHAQEITEAVAKLDGKPVIICKRMLLQVLSGQRKPGHFQLEKVYPAASRKCGGDQG